MGRGLNNKNSTLYREKAANAKADLERVLAGADDVESVEVTIEGFDPSDEEAEGRMLMDVNTTDAEGRSYKRRRKSMSKIRYQAYLKFKARIRELNKKRREKINAQKLGKGQLGRQLRPELRPQRIGSRMYYQSPSMFDLLAVPANMIVPTGRREPRLGEQQLLLLVGQQQRLLLRSRVRQDLLFRKVPRKIARKSIDQDSADWKAEILWNLDQNIYQIVCKHVEITKILDHKGL